METRSAKRRKLHRNPPRSHDRNDEDRISDLPDHILHNILSLLSIKSAARAGMLSRRWKNIWYSFPDLDFTTVNYMPPPAAFNSKVRRNLHPHYARGDEIAGQITSLLEKHSDIRVLRFRAYLTFSRLSGLIRHAVKRNVQELDIEVHTSDKLNFPRSVISSSSSSALRVFRLKSCFPGFRLPPLQLLKDGFRSLSALSLTHIILNDHPSLANLFTDSSFPSLKKLHLESCLALEHLRVESPALEEFTLIGCFQLVDLGIRVRKLKRLKVSWCFDPYGDSSRVMIEAPNIEVMLWSYNSVTKECVLQSLQHLREAFVSFFPLGEEVSAAKILSMRNLLAGISCCRSLTLEGKCIETLSKNTHFAGLPICSFNKLKSLQFTTFFSNHTNTGLAYMFINSPAIHTVTINVIGDDSAHRQSWNEDLWQSTISGEEQYWESQTQSLSPFLHHLKVVNIYRFTGCATEMSLVKFLLKHGKVLQQVFLGSRRLCLSKKSDSLLRNKIESRIMGFPRANFNANIVFQ